jgi:acyl-CoA thioesterase-1
MMNKKNGLLALSLAILLTASATVAFFILAWKKEAPSSNAIRVACVGDSLTQSSGYPYKLWELFGRSANYTVGNYSIGPDDDSGVLSNGTSFAVGNFGAGSTTVLLDTETPYMNTSVFRSALEFQPNIVVIMLGTNDAQPNLEQLNASFVYDYLRLVDAFKSLESKPKIWIVLPPPIFSNQSGKIDPSYFTLTIIPHIRQVAEESDAPLIDVYSALVDYPNYFPDGEHPNSAAAELIANEIYLAVAPNKVQR